MFFGSDDKRRQQENSDNNTWIAKSGPWRHNDNQLPGADDETQPQA
jgi:hypothetical protein